MQAELQKLINEFLSSNPGGEYFLADELKVSLPTIERWRKGKNLPYESVVKPIIEHLKNLLED